MACTCGLRRGNYSKLRKYAFVAVCHISRSQGIAKRFVLWIAEAKFVGNQVLSLSHWS